jgi:hypothetical protein
MIPVDVPTSDARRERIEREVLAQVAAMRAAERADLRVPRRGHRRRWLAGGFAACAAIAAIVVLSRAGREPAAPVASAPSRIVTPEGGASRFIVEDAVIDAGSDTSVEVNRDRDGSVTLVLARGSVDCDVAPRAGRGAFRVVAGDVEVAVVGTRFTVTRRPAVRVDVARGKVRVTASGVTTYVAAGESWPAIAPAAAAPQTAPEAAAEPEPELDPQPAPSPTHQARAELPIASQAEFDAARKRGPPALRALAADRRGPWAALALWDHAEATSGSDPDLALRELAEYEHKFPHGDNSEDVAWTRVEILKRQQRAVEMRRAAADFVRRYPASVYAATARQLATP